MADGERTSPWGFVGLGEMGAPMAARLLANGIRVVAYDPDAARLAAAVAKGAAAASSVAEIARAAPVVSVCVRDDHQLEAVLDDGLAAPAPAGGVVVIHSTIGRPACLAAGARLAAHGWAVLDAPVSGMRMAAEAGTLAFFAGGDADALARVRHGLDAMGHATIHVGDLGSGQVTKIANNLVAFASAAIIHEATELARGAGIAEERLLEALACGSARSWAVENWPFLRRGWADSQPGGAPAVRAIVEKDLQLATAAAAAAGVDAPFADLARQTMPGVLAGG